MNTITMSAITVTLFFGGPDGPIPHIPHTHWLWPILWFLGKTIVFLFVFVWLRAALPRLRYDQLMDLGWKRLIPLSLGWLLIVAGFVIDGWWGLGMAVAVVVAAVVHHPGLRHRRRARGDPGHRARGRRPPVEPAAEPAAPGRPAPTTREVTADGEPEPPHQRQNFLGGFKLTLEHLGRPPVTRQYPEEKRPKQPRQHGRHVLNRYEDGMEKCIGCELCAGVCPADCIYVRGLDNPPDHPVSPGERYGYVYEINFLRCIHCDLCVEACPTEAITESKLMEFSFTNRERRHLHQGGAAGRRRRASPSTCPWEDWREGDDLHTSGWMRATSPAGERRVRGRGPVVGRARLRGPRRPRAARAAAATTPPPAACRSGTPSSATCVPADLPAAKRGPRGAIGRMLEKAERFAPGAGKKHREQADAAYAEALAAGNVGAGRRAAGARPPSPPAPDGGLTVVAALGGRPLVVAATATHPRSTSGSSSVAAAIVLAGAIGVVVARNPVHSALMLVMTLFGVAVLFVLQQARFLAAVQVIVYAGAIVVLFLFVIMFLGVDREENIAAEPLRGQRPAGRRRWSSSGRPASCCSGQVSSGRPAPPTWPGSTPAAVQRLPARASRCTPPTCSPSRPPRPC